MYQKRTKGWMKHFDFILLDLICLQLAFVLAYRLRIGDFGVYENLLYRNMALFLSLIDIAVIFFRETYKNVLKRGYYKEFTSTLKHTSIVIAISALYLFSIQEATNYSRLVLWGTFAAYLLLSYGTRVIWKRHLERYHMKQEKKSILLITSKELAEGLIHNFRKDNYGGYVVKGLVLVGDDMVGQSIHGIPVVANLEEVAQYVCHEWVDAVFIDTYFGVDVSNTFVEDLIATGVTIHQNLTKISNVSQKRQLVERMGGYSVLTTSINYMTDKDAVLKRMLDICGALVGCFLTGLLILVIGPVIYFSSPGPIFFSQIRVGQNGKCFKIYKFRSMYLDAEERKKELMEQNRVKDGMMFKVDFDTRIIGNRILPSGKKKRGIGDFIRKTSLDEFPQFFNVLKGEMSLVGTRPPTVDEWEKYELHHRARLATKPGITGMWQVSGRSDITDFEEVVKLDTKYIDEWSMGLDLKILFKTVLQVLKREGSM